MHKNRILLPAAFVAVIGFAACDTADDMTDDATTTTQEVITEPGMEEREIMVPTEDTMLVETEVDVDVDTTEIDGDLEDTVTVDPMN